MSDLKLCVQCRHMKDADCQHPNNMQVSMIDGVLKPIHTLAYLRQMHPESYMKCEPCGKWWEAIEAREAA